MEIIRLDKSVYEGKKFTARYKTSGYYDIRAFNDGFKIEYLRLKEPIEKSFEDEFFGKWLENPTAYGAFEGKKLLGYAEGSIESWNNRFRISNICVFENSERRRGIGTALIEKISKTAKSLKARMIVLETQSHSTKNTDSKLSVLICFHIRTTTRYGMKFALKWVKNYNVDNKHFYK